MNKHPIMLAILIGLVACSPAALLAAAPMGASPTPSPVPTTNSSSSLDADTVYSLLTAELAGQRDQLDISFNNYLQEAKKTKDPVIAERATNIAQQMRDGARIMSAAQVWVELAPNNPEPRTILIQQLSKANRYDEIAPHIDAILKINADADLQAIAMGAEELTSDNLHTLIKVLTAASEKYPQNISLHLTVARLLMVDKQWSAATKQLTDVLNKDSKQEQALLLQSEVLLAQNKSSDAVKLISAAITRGADSKRVQVYYARLLLEDKQTAAAKKQFEHVTELYPDDSDILFTLALLSLDSDLQDLSKKYFQKLIDVGAHGSEAHYYLGQISENENHPDAALAHYSKIEPGSDVYLAGVANSALILLKQGKGNEAITYIEQSRNLNPDLGIDLYLIESDVLLKQDRAQEAVNLLTKALIQYKNQPDLLYARSLAAEKANNLALVEKDLRFLIKQDPNNVSALNALGYTLASRTNRLQEALELITKALALRPNDPAIIDSMGWVQFHLGNYQQSLELLRRAYKNFPDEEVASHLVEVLWVMGKKDEATQVFAESLKQNPNSALLNSTMNRLNKTSK